MWVCGLDLLVFDLLYGWLWLRRELAYVGFVCCDVLIGGVLLIVLVIYLVLWFVLLLALLVCGGCLVVYGVWRLLMVWLY